MKELEKFVEFNSSIVLNVKNNTTTLTQCDRTLELDYQEYNTLVPIEEILAPLEGKCACIVSSDILDLENKQIKLKRLEEHVLHKVLTLTLEHMLPYLSKVAKEEDGSIMIQPYYDSEEPALSISAGVMGDIQVLLLDVYYERYEGKLPC